MNLEQLKRANNVAHDIAKLEAVLEYLDNPAGKHTEPTVGVVVQAAISASYKVQYVELFGKGEPGREWLGEWEQELNEYLRRSLQARLENLRAQLAEM